MKRATKSRQPGSHSDGPPSGQGGETSQIKLPGGIASPESAKSNIDATFSCLPDADSRSRQSGFVPGSVIGGRYRIISLLERGGMGSVYKVEDLQSAEILALKTLTCGKVSSVAWRRFEKEAEAAATLEHSCLIKVHDFGVHGEQPFFVMDFAEGETLTSLLSKGPLPLDTVLEMGHQLCLGLAHAHSRKIVHRDIKPSNIIVANAEDPSKLEVTIVDFGVARMLANEDATQLTRTGEIFGTPSYMSPEQSFGSAVDERSDIYAFGCVLFEALTGLPPFMSDTALSILLKHQAQTPPSLKQASLGRKFPPELELVVAKLLQKDPRQRYQNMLDVARDLSRIRAGQPVHLGNHDRPERRNAKLLYLAVFMFFVALLGALVALCQMMLSSFSTDSCGIGTATVVTPPVSATTRNGKAGRYIVGSGYFSSPNPLSPSCRFFHFPVFSLGTVDFGERSQASTFTHSEWSNQGHRVEAKGEVVVKNFKGLELAPSTPVYGNPQLLRGFRSQEVVALDLTNARYPLVDVEMMNEIAALSSLRKLAFPSRSSLSDPSIAAINRLKYLEELYLFDCSITPSGLLKLDRLKNLSSLALCSRGNVTELLTGLAGCKSLKRLCLADCRLTDADMELIARLPNLEFLFVPGNPALTDRSITSLERLHRLHVLDIRGCSPALTADAGRLKPLPMHVLYVDVSTSDRQNLHRLLPDTHITSIHRTLMNNSYAATEARRCLEQRTP